MKYLLCFLLITCLFPRLSCAIQEDHAATPANGSGYVQALIGEVYRISEGGVTEALHVKDPINPGDVIVTEEKSRIQIVFRDSTVVTFGENSRVRLQSYDWQEKDKNGNFHLSIKEGIFRIIGGKLTKHSPKNFTTDTPSASIGIRGSSYAGSVAGDRLRVFLYSGIGIDVTNAKGSVPLLAKGLGTDVADWLTAPTLARQFSQQEMDELLQPTSFARNGTGTGSSSTIDGTVINRTEISNSTNIAVGRDNQASMGSVVIKNSRINGTVINDAKISNASNVASGSNNEAIMGSIEIE